MGVAPLDLPRREAVAVDWGIGVVVMGISVLLGLLAATVPAIWAARAPLSSLLASSAVRGGGGHGRLRRGMVAAQVALTLVLLSAGGLVVRSVERLLRADPGFRPDRVLTVRVPMPSDLFLEGAAKPGDALQVPGDRARVRDTNRFLALQDRVADALAAGRATAILEVLGVYLAGGLLTLLLARVLGIQLVNPLNTFSADITNDELIVAAWQLFVLLMLQYVGYFLLIVPLNWWHRRRGLAAYGLTAAGHPWTTLLLAGLATAALVQWPVAYSVAMIVSLLIMAIGYGVVFAWTRSLVPSIVAHAIINVPMTPLWQSVLLTAFVLCAAALARRGVAALKQVFSSATVVGCVALAVVGAAYAIASEQVNGFGCGCDCNAGSGCRTRSDGSEGTSRPLADFDLLDCSTCPGAALPMRATCYW